MKTEKIEKLAAILHDKKENVIHIRYLKQGLSHRLVLKRLHRVIKFNQKASLQSYMNMNTELRKWKKKTVLKKTFNLIYNTVFRKLIKMWHNTDIRLVTTKEKKHYLVSELNYQTAKKKLLEIY